MPVVTTGVTPRLSIQRPAGRAISIPAAPGMPIKPACAGPNWWYWSSIVAMVAQNPP